VCVYFLYDSIIFWMTKFDIRTFHWLYFFLNFLNFITNRWNFTTMQKSSCSIFVWQQRLGLYRVSHESLHKRRYTLERETLFDKFIRVFNVRHWMIEYAAVDVPAFFIAWRLPWWSAVLMYVRWCRVSPYGIRVRQCVMLDDFDVECCGRIHSVTA